MAVLSRLVARHSDTSAVGADHDARAKATARESVEKNLAEQELHVRSDSTFIGHFFCQPFIRLRGKENNKTVQMLM